MQNFKSDTFTIVVGPWRTSSIIYSASPFSNLCCGKKKYLTCLTSYPSIVKGDLDYSRFPEGNLESNGHVIQFDDQDNFQSK